MFNEIFEKSPEDIFNEVMGEAFAPIEEFNLIPIARQIMRDAFKDDPDFRRAYTDNIAMRLYDNQMWNNECLLDFKDKLTRDRIANDIFDLIFG